MFPGGFIRGLIGISIADNYVSALSDEEIVTKFALIRTREELTSDLKQLYWV